MTEAGVICRIQGGAHPRELGPWSGLSGPQTQSHIHQTFLHGTLEVVARHRGAACFVVLRCRSRFQRQAIFLARLSAISRPVVNPAKPLRCVSSRTLSKELNPVFRMKCKRVRCF